MSELRDARFRKALESAPDEDLRPREATRMAIRQHAHRAARPGALARWWQLLAGRSGGSPVPWQAALATVAVATLVTLLWHDRETPGARPDSESAAPAMPAVDAAAPPQATAPASEPAPAAAPQRRADSLRAEQAESAARAQSAREASEREAAAREASAREALAREALAREARERSSADAAAKARHPAPPELAKATAPEASPPSTPDAGAARTESLSRAARAPAPASPSLEMQRQLAAEAPTTVRVAMAGRIVEAPLERPSTLSALIERLSRQAAGSEPLHAPTDTRVELKRDGQLLGVLELAGPQVQWTPASGAVRTGTPEPALLQALRDEIDRLLR